MLGYQNQRQYNDPVDESASKQRYPWEIQGTNILNQEKQTPLHNICQQQFATLDRVQKLLEADPSATAKQDVYGRTPLFYSLKQGCSPKLVQLLFETYPSAITMLDFCGETPMSLVYHKNKDPCILKGILEYQPSLASQRIQSFSGPDLVQLVCSPWKNFDTRNAAVIRNHKELSNQWEKVVLTCTAAHKCRHLRSKHDQDTKELHIALELPCSPKILCCFLRMYPEQANMPLPNGMLPLHKYVSSKELLKQTGSSDVIAELIATTPAASSTLYQGNSPLHLAIESGCKWDDGLCQLFYSAPNSLQLLGANSKLFPFMMAATIDPIDLNTVYSLLREGPILIQ